MKIKVSEFIANRVAAAGIRHVFMVTGGGAMHLNDSFAKHPQLKTVFNHHEQASAMAAESYARLRGIPAILNVTTGPGGINAMNGVFGAYTDSIPMIVISGQVRYDTTVQSSGRPLRQLGDQEFAGVIDCARTMSKYAVVVTDPLHIQHHLDKAIRLASSGRPGPVWLDIPMNVQGAYVDEHELARYAQEQAECAEPNPPIEAGMVREVLSLISQAERPVIYAGTGVWLSGAREALLRLVESLGVPVVSGFGAHDLVPTGHPLYAGRPGSNGDRAGNFAVQNSDLLLVIGCRLNIRQIGYNWTSFARAAKKIMVDIDPEELRKPTLQIDMPIHADARDFIEQLLQHVPEAQAGKQEWIRKCQNWKQRYPVVLPEYWERKELVNPYCFVDRLFHHLRQDAIVACANATACVTVFQAGNIQNGQRVFSNSGSASMGYDLPAAIGAAFAFPAKPIICMAGDGSIQMNLQELQTIKTYGLPIKIIVLNNQGYHSIRQTQKNFFGEPLIGCQEHQGIDFPDMEKLAAAYGYPYYRISRHAEMDQVIQSVLAMETAVICEVMLTPDQAFAPKPSSVRLPDGRMVSRPLEDQAPFLDREELKQNMIIPLLGES